MMVIGYRDDLLGHVAHPREVAEATRSRTSAIKVRTDFPATSDFEERQAIDGPRLRVPSA